MRWTPFPQLPVDQDLASPSTLEEVRRAIGKLQKGKSAGISGILPEMLKFGGKQLFLSLHGLFGDVWREGRVPQEWVDAMLVPRPRKGDLSGCDNWRGISLLDVVSKALAGVIQLCLQSLAKEFFPESQCGFRRDRACSDMIIYHSPTLGKDSRTSNQGFLCLHRFAKSL